MGTPVSGPWSWALSCLFLWSAVGVLRVWEVGALKGAEEADDFPRRGAGCQLPAQASPICWTFGLTAFSM